MRLSSTYRIICVLILLCNASHLCPAQDSLVVQNPPRFFTFGFQASFVSGMGISFGHTWDHRFRARITGGAIKSEGETIFAVGGDLHYELSNRPDLHIFIGPSFGTAGGSARLPRPRLAFGTGLEIPLTGSELYENISAGAVLYYPTFFFRSETISFATGIFLVYNF